MSHRAVSCCVSLLLCVNAACSYGDNDLHSADAAAIDVFGPYLGVEANHFAAVLDAFTEQTGIEVRYTGSNDFSSDLRRRMSEITSAPDVAMVPQLGLVRDLVDTGLVASLDDATTAAIETNYTDATRMLGTIDGSLVGVPFRANIKSLIWYRPDIWEANGWTVPSSLSELAALSLQMSGEPGLAPWCLTMKSGTATGWIATDWVEDLMIRDAGPDDYRAWTRGQLAFDSEPVRSAFTEFQRLVLATGRLAGGTTAALGSPVREIFDGLFADPPACAMAKQADFAASWLPDGTTIGADGDIDFFVMPTTDADDDPPLVVGGDLALPITPSDQVAALMTYLAGPDSGVQWAREGGFLSPKSSFPADEYRDVTIRELADRLTSARTVVYDASDQMPVEIGTDLLWTEITKWVAGGLGYDDFATTIDEAFAELDG